jgi:hypothetical protein
MGAAGFVFVLHACFPANAANETTDCPALALTQRPNWLGVGLTLNRIASLAIYPSWPLVWLGQISTYQGLFRLCYNALRAIVSVGALRYRDRKTWLYLLMAVMPQRVLYDQMALFFNCRQS